MLAGIAARGKQPSAEPPIACGTYLIGTHRTAATTNPDCTNLYVRDLNAYKRTTPVGQLELAARTRFTQVRAAVAARKKNLSTINADQAAWLDQKDQAGGYSTFNAYLWKVCGDEYDAQH